MMNNKTAIRDFRRILRKLENEIGMTLSDETDCCGVTVAQCHVLLETEYLGTANLGDLADALELDKSTLSRTVDGLCQAGLIDRKDDPANRRKVTIQLSEKGKEKADSINTLCDDAYTRVFNCIPKNKEDLVLEAVALLAEAMRKSRKEKTWTCCEKT